MGPQHQYITEWLASIHQESAEAAHQDQGGNESDRAKYQRKRKRPSDCISSTSRRQQKSKCLPDKMPTTPPPSNTEGQGHLPFRSHTSTSTSGEAGEGHGASSGGSSGDNESGSVSPKKRRRVDEAAAAADLDRTPTAASVTSRSIPRCPVMTPKSKTRGRNASPIKTVSSLRQLQKPVHIVALSNNYKDLLPEDTYNLYRNIRQRMNSGFVPAPIKDEFLRACGSDADLVSDTWFYEPDLQTSESAAEQRATLLAQLNQLVSVQLVAAESAQLGRNEPAWNCKVHQPLLDLVCGNVRRESGTLAQVRAENISAATITGDCVPRLWVESTAAAGSVPACSVTATSVSSASTDEACHDDDVFRPEPFVRADSHVHSRFGSKKVDFALVISPPEESPLRLAVDRALQGLAIRALAASVVRDVPEPSQSINPTAYAPLLRDPIAVAIETKSTTANKDPLVQLGFIIAAFHRRLLTLSSPGRPLPVRLIPTVPLISVVDHNWTLYFAVDRRNRVVSAVTANWIVSRLTFLGHYRACEDGLNRIN
jgi:hypothetical protein